MNIGLVLSGGMAKGAFQVGALRAISEFIPLEEIKYISCASVGVLNGYAFATQNLDKAEKMWRNMCSNDSRLIISQVLRSSLLQRGIKKIYDSEKALPMTFYSSLLDITHKNLIYKDFSRVNNKLLPLYLKASVAMPVYNHAVTIGNVSYYDGAMVDNIPVYPLMKHNLDYIICIYFDDTFYKFENTYFDNKIIKLTFPASSRLKQSLVFRKEGIEEMIDIGYKRTTEILSPIFSKGYDSLDYIYNTIDFINKNCNEKSMRITGDVLVTYLNKVIQRIAKRGDSC